VKQRKLLKNILVMHGSLDILLDAIELASGTVLYWYLPVPVLTGTGYPAG
jgi:hypothetical protein